MIASLAIWTSEHHVMMLTADAPDEIKTLILRWLSRGAHRIVIGYESKAYLVIPTNDKGNKYWRTELAPDHELTWWTFPLSAYTRNASINTPV